MDFSPLPTSSLIGAFLLAFPALFSIVNPVGAALIFDQAMGNRSRPARLKLARAIGFYAFLVLLGSLLLVKLSAVAQARSCTASIAAAPSLSIAT